jgi:hypothetical protein
MLLIVVMDVVQVFQQCYVVPMAVEAACFSGRPLRPAETLLAGLPIATGLAATLLLL